MQLVDSSFVILTNDAHWTETTDILVNKAFMTPFKVLQNTNARRNPVITMYFTCESKQ